MGASAGGYVQLAVTAVGAVASAVGAYKQGQAAQASSEYQAKVAENNKILAERKAQDAIKRGQEAERQQRIKTRQLIGRQRASLAANGVVVDQDSALDITSDTAALGEVDALTIRQNAEREALGYRTEGMNYQSQADLSRMRGDSEYTSGLFGVAGSVFDGATSVASKWYTMNSQGVFDSKKKTNSFSYEGMT